MSSPLAEAFLLVTLNNCYETPSNYERDKIIAIIAYVILIKRK